MKKTALTSLFLLIVISLFQCLQKKEPAITKDRLEFSGRYVGVLPCADCDGTRYDLTLIADGTCSEEMKYIGKSDDMVRHSCKWYLENDSTLRVEGDGGPRSFLAVREKLILLDKRGKKVESSSSAMYSLKKVEDDFDEMVSQAMNMGRMGMMAAAMEDMETDFSAQGSEPYWTLKVDFENGMTFKAMEDIEIHATILNVDSDAALIQFRGEEGTTRLVVTVAENECSDGMSEEAFRNKVKVDIKTEGEGEHEPFEGCGNYNFDYRLHDIWVLTHINDQPVKPENEALEIPTFEFYSKEERLMGNMGCNDFNGGFYRTGQNEIQMGELALTRKICPDMSTERLISQALSGKRVKYEIKDLNLILKGYDGTKLTFKKVD